MLISRGRPKSLARSENTRSALSALFSPHWLQAFLRLGVV